MISHINIGINDFDRQHRFYSGLMEILGHRQRFADQEKAWAAWQPAAGGRPLVIIAKPFDGGTASPGNGQMTAFEVSSRDAVDKAHAYAVAQGGRDEGAPGIRAHYHPNYYGAYFRDPEGNKLCVVCHKAE
jgi:catechol 2,3-dioxygenase-like lactoylglutathione lyase family enzyme